MDDAVTEDVQRLVADVFETDEPGPDDALERLETWDSLRVLNLLLALEEHFGVEMTPDDVAELTSVSAIVALVSARR